MSSAPSSSGRANSRTPSGGDDGDDRRGGGRLMARTNVGAAAKRSVRRIRTTEKTLKALELRKRGLNYTQIGEKLGCARGTACRYVLSELENLADKCREEAVHVRDLELQRLDALYLK